MKSYSGRDRERRSERVSSGLGREEAQGGHVDGTMGLVLVLLWHGMMRGYHSYRGYPLADLTRHGHPPGSMHRVWGFLYSPRFGFRVQSSGALEFKYSRRGASRGTGDCRRWIGFRRDWKIRSIRSRSTHSSPSLRPSLSSSVNLVLFLSDLRALLCTIIVVENRE